MDEVHFDTFFKVATGGLDPFDYQRHLACGERDGRSKEDWLSSDANCRSLLINVPTGGGKTAAVVLAWLWNRVALQRENWPRRLVYCLPMRVLVEQTRDNALVWLNQLGLLGGSVDFETRDGRRRPRYTPHFADPGKVTVHLLMGGEDEDDWDLYPERQAILIGTQDMLLSRALNRGYAASRARWPMHFGLLNTDCLWVFDEVQLMGSGLATTTQLEGLRWLLGSKDGHGCRSIWMSATLQRDWLKTVDLRDRVDGLEVLALTDDDFQSKDLENRWKAPKPLDRAKTPMGDAPSLASEILRTHKPRTRTIVVVNTVRRACDLFEALRTQVDTGKAKGRGRKRGQAPPLEAAPTDRTSKPALVLLHSRFRQGDRAQGITAALADPPAVGTIVVSTQVIEAGVDVSATTLFTELAPWASLVQRFGRCNRRGEVNNRAAVRWIDLPETDAGAAKVVLPYELDDLKRSAEHLRSLKDAGLGSLPDIELRFERTHVIRRKDLIDLFDTTPDLAGNDIDIDRFIRDVEETDVRVFWRDWPQPKSNEPPPEDEPAPRRAELCPVPVGEFRGFVRDDKRKGKAWRWNFLDGKWERVDARKIVPGQVFLVHAGAGGYQAERGWDATSGKRVDPILPENAQEGAPADATDADSASRIGVWQTIGEHTDEVCRELDAIVNEFGNDDVHAPALRVAARWHDRGKAHVVFQNAVDDGQEVQRRNKTVQRRERPDGWRGCRFVAKAPQKKAGAGTVVDPGFWQRYDRRHFRHELASALAVLDPRNTQVPDDLRDPIAYIVAAHHGKVRLSLRSLPDEKKPRDSDGRLQPSKRFARGVWDGDELPATDLGGGVIAPVATLSLEPMELGLCEQEPFTGQRSWGERMIRLRASLGPFTLAYLETLLRVADMRASRTADQPGAASTGTKEGRNV